MAFRNRVLMLCRDRFLAAGGGEYLQSLWRETHRRFTYLLGEPRLSNSNHQADPEINDVLQFLAACSDVHFLDFIEYIFQAPYYFHACPDEDDTFPTL